MAPLRELRASKEEALKRDGGDLSIQDHPRPEFIREHFGETFTQDASYYISDCKPASRVYLGSQAGIDPQAFREALERSHKQGSHIAIDRIVHSAPLPTSATPGGTVPARWVRWKEEAADRRAIRDEAANPGSLASAQRGRPSLSRGRRATSQPGERARPLRVECSSYLQWRWVPREPGCAPGGWLKLGHDQAPWDRRSGPGPFRPPAMGSQTLNVVPLSKELCTSIRPE